MTQRIINAISMAIDEVFPDIPILDETAEQDVGRPAFFISCYHSFLTERIIPAGFFKTYNFEITYDPGMESPEPTCHEVEDVLMLQLRRIKDPESAYAFRPINIEFRQTEGYLEIMFDIVVEIRVITEPDPDIERYFINTGVDNA